MRSLAFLILSYFVIRSDAGSAVASDLALLARSPHDNPAIKLPGSTHSEKSKTLLHKEESHVRAIQGKDSQPLNFWRVRVALAIVIVAIVLALAALATHTARVFGWIPEKVSQEPLSPKNESDPESLTRLLNMQSIKGYGAIFTSRGVFGSASPGPDKPTIIIQ